MDRRHFLKGAGGSALALSIRSLLTGLPPAFLLSGTVKASDASDASRKFGIIALSGAGESVNGCGPGSFDNPNFIHPSPGSTDLRVTIAGREFGALDLSETTQYLDGPQPVRIARCFEALGPMQDDMAFFHHRTSLGIHPQFPIAKKIGGAIKGPDGRGEEELVSAIAQENAASLGTVLSQPIVLSNSVTFQSTPLNTYAPTVIKELVASGVASAVPEQIFSAARNRLVDDVYGRIKDGGNPNQKRFLDEFVLSQTQADEVASKLMNEVVNISDDGLMSQMRMAAIIVKLRLAPAVAVGYRFSGDNHVADGLSIEAEDTLNMMAAYRDFYDFANTMGVWEDCLYATLSVFGRSMDERGNGRGHNGSLSTGLLFGSHLQRKVVGGLDPTSDRGASLPFNAATGALDNPNVSVSDGFASYAKTVLKAAGVPDDRLEVRVRDVPAVTLT